MTTYRVATVTNNGSPKRDHPVFLSFTATSSLKADGSDIVCTLNDGLSILGHSTNARSGFYRPLWNSGSKLVTIKATLPWIPKGTSTFWIQYGNASQADQASQAITFQSATVPSDQILVNAGKVGTKQYVQAQTHVLETQDGKAIQYYSAFGGNAGNDGQLWQWVSTDYLTTTDWQTRITHTKLLEPGGGNSVSSYGNGVVRSNGDVLVVIGVGTNAQIAANTEPLYVVKRVGNGISDYTTQNALPNPQLASTLQLPFGKILEQSNGDLWLFVIATRPTESAGGGGLGANGGNWSIYILSCASGNDPTNGNNWGLLGGTFANATVVQGGNLIVPGTVAATNGLATVTGTGTTFTRQFYGNGASIAGNIYIAGVEYAVLSVTDDTHLTLTTNYTGSTASGLAVGLGMSANEHGVAMDANGNLALSFWNNSQGTGVGPVMHVFSLSRSGGIPVWTLPGFLSVPGGAYHTGNQTDVFIDANGFLVHTSCRSGADITIYTSCDWLTAAGSPTWNYPLNYNLAVPVDSGSGDRGVSTATILKNGVNKNVLHCTMYYPPGGSVTNTSGNGVTPITITAPSSALATGQSVTIASVGGNTAANGTFTITRIDDNSFTIPATGNGNYTSGGTWALSTGLQRNIALITTDLLGVVNVRQFLENWDAGTFTNWTAHGGSTISTAQILNGRTNSCLCANPVLERTGTWVIGQVQESLDFWFYANSGNPAFALSVANERYAWLSGSSPFVPKFYNGSVSSNTFPNATTVTSGAWHNGVLSIDSNTVNDANKLTLQLTVDGVWLGQGALVTAGNQFDIYFDFITAANYYVADIATKPWTDQEPSVSVGPELTPSKGIPIGLFQGAMCTGRVAA